jgi:uncharacterized protein YjbI with pentapeptide repeats
MVPGRLEALDFSSANLTRARLARTTMVNVRFDGADLTGADLSGADLSAAVGLGTSQLESAITDENTKLPAYLT